MWICLFRKTIASYYISYIYLHRKMLFSGNDIRVCIMYFLYMLLLNRASTSFVLYTEPVHLRECCTTYYLFVTQTQKCTVSPVQPIGAAGSCYVFCCHWGNIFLMGLQTSLLQRWPRQCRLSTTKNTMSHDVMLEDGETEKSVSKTLMLPVREIL